MTITLTSTALTEAVRRTILRRLAGDLDDTELTDVNCDEMLNRFDNWAETQTNNFTWDGTEDKFPTFVSASSLMASAEYLDGHPGVDPSKAGNQRIAARDAIKAVNQKDTSIQKASVFAIAEGVNIANDLDSDVYTKDQTIFTNT